MSGTADSVRPDPGYGVTRRVVPWLVLTALVMVATVILSGFRAQVRSTPGPSSPGTSVPTSSADASAPITVTGTIAVTRVADVRLRYAGDERSDTIAIVKKGTKLQVLARTDTWLRVKDPAGHIGWIRNSSKIVELRYN